MAKNKGVKLIPDKRINYNELADKAIKEAKEKADESEKRIIEIHNKISLLL